MKAATVSEHRLLAERVGTTKGNLEQYAGGFRAPSAAMGIALEREIAKMHRASKGRLPVVLRTDLVTACRQCEFARRCLGDKVDAGDFPIVV